MFDKGKLDEIRKAREEWEKTFLKPALEKIGPKREMMSLGIGHLETPFREIYTPLDLEEIGFDYLRDVGFPGAYPCTRGTEPTRDPQRPWLIRLYAGYGTPRQSNERYKFVLKEGAEEIVMAVDLPTQIGYDADHAMSAGEVGRVGVSLSSLRDMEEAFDAIPLNSMRRVAILGNAIGPIALAFFIALGEKQGLSHGDYVVDLQNDVIKEYGTRGTQFLPAEPAVRLATDVVEYCVEHHPNWQPLTACAAHYGLGGCAAAHAAGLSAAFHYIDVLLKKGLDIDRFAHMFSLFTLGEPTFAGVAVIRAARRIWSRTLREKYGAKVPRSLALKMTAYTIAESTAQQTMNNIIRIAYGTQTYALAGVDYIYNASYDEGLAIPTEEAARLAIRTQQILANETEIPYTVDPFAGSYFVESLTTRVENEIRRYLKEIERIGGPIPAIEAGWIQKQMGEEAYKKRVRIEKGERIHVGVNKYRVEGEGVPTTFQPDPACAEKRIASLNQLKKERGNAEVKRCLARIKEVSKAQENVVPAVLDAVRAYATLGEICDVWRDVFGEYEFPKAYM
jgi:methylmalonyl-CoA mutase N-terminal domain/subunit